MEKRYSTPQAAPLIGVHPLTLHRWIKAGKMKPKSVPLPDGRKVWLWSEEDIAKGKRLKVEQKPGPKPKAKAK